MSDAYNYKVLDEEIEEAYIQLRECKSALDTVARAFNNTRNEYFRLKREYETLDRKRAKKAVRVIRPADVAARAAKERAANSNLGKLIDNLDAAQAEKLLEKFKKIAG